MISENDQILAEVVSLMGQLADDWEYSGIVGESTLLLGDLGMESLDLVVLGSSLQQRYGRLPFTEFLAEIGERPADTRDVTVGELVAFVTAHRQQLNRAENR